jgi:hypothetical protein
MNRPISYLIIADIFFCLVSVTSANSFLDSRTLTLFGDNNIFDGLQLQSSDVDLTFYTTDSLTYTVTVSGSGQSLSMVRSGNLLSLNPQRLHIIKRSHRCVSHYGARGL